MPNLDLFPRHQDWNKQTVDFPEFEGDASDFRDFVAREFGVEAFKRLPVYRMNEDHPLFSEL